MTNEELALKLFGGDDSVMPEIIAKLDKCDRATLAMSKMKEAFNYAKDGDFAAINVAVSIAEEWSD